MEREHLTAGKADSPAKSWAELLHIIQDFIQNGVVNIQ